MSDTRVKLALYRGPGHTLLERTTHTLTCAVVSVRKRRWETHSHAELVIDGVAYSASLRDRGVRAKEIDFGDSWDIYPVHLNDAHIDESLELFTVLQLQGYDVDGALAWALPCTFAQNDKKMFCFELVATMLGIPNPSAQSALDLLAVVKKINAEASMRG